MKHRAKYIALFSAMLLLLMTSCFEDKGNYDYREIQDASVTIPGVTDQKDQIDRDRYDVLALNPEIEFQAGSSAGDFDFEWSLYLQTSIADADGKYPAKKIIGDAQNLNYSLVDMPDKYYVVLKTTHRTTKVCTDYRFKLNINSVKGWLVYDESGTGDGDFQIIRDEQIVPGLATAQNGVVRNYFSASNNGTKLRDGLFLSQRTVSRYDHLFLYTRTGVVKMGAGAYDVLTTNYSDLFLVAPKVINPMAHYYPNSVSGAMELFMNDREVHLIRWNMMGQVDKLPAPLASFGTPIKFKPFAAPIPVVAGTANRYVLMSGTNMNGQFVVINSGGGQTYPTTPTGVFNTGKINADATTKLELFKLAQGRDGLTNAIFKDALNGDRPWLYVADFRTATALAINKIDLGSLPGISSAKLFAFGTRGDVMFYAAGSKVYSYVYDGSTTDLLDVSGDEIVSMKVYTHSNNENFSGRILFVATYNAGTNTGKVHKIMFNELNGQKEGEVTSFDGFGRIVDMINKE